MKTNILLTGGAGYIGSHVVNLLIDKGFSVTVIDSLVTGNKNLVNKKANLIISDIANIKKVTQLLKLKKFEIVLHFAGLIRVDESVKKPQKYLNYKTMLNISIPKFDLKYNKPSRPSLHIALSNFQLISLLFFNMQNDIIQCIKCSSSLTKHYQ